MCVFKNLPVKEGGRNVSIAVWVSEDKIIDFCLLFLFWRHLFVSDILYRAELHVFLVDHQGDPSLVITQTQVSASLNSWPVVSYRRAEPLPYGVQLTLVVDWDMLDVGLVHWVSNIFVVKWL